MGQRLGCLSSGYLFYYFANYSGRGCAARVGVANESATARGKIA